MSENDGAEEEAADGTATEGDPATDGADAADAAEGEGATRQSEVGSEDGSRDGADVADAGDAGDAEDEAGVETDEELRERVAEADPEELANEIAALRERAEDAEDRAAEAEERAGELESKLKRKQADFQNFKKRQQRKLEDQRRRATEDLVERMLDVRDNLVRALDQDEDADIRPGVEKTLDQFDRVLDAEDVRTIDPDAGEAVDPERHEVLMRVDSEHPAGTVEEVHRPGYEMGERVLRPAQVTVAEE